VRFLQPADRFEHEMPRESIASRFHTQSTLAVSGKSVSSENSETNPHRKASKARSDDGSGRRPLLQARKTR